MQCVTINYVIYFFFLDKLINVFKLKGMIVKIDLEISFKIISFDMMVRGLYYVISSITSFNLVFEIIHLPHGCRSSTQLISNIYNRQIPLK